MLVLPLKKSTDKKGVALTSLLEDPGYGSYLKQVVPAYITKSHGWVNPEGSSHAVAKSASRTT